MTMEPNWKCNSFNVDSLIFSARRVLFVLRIRDLLVPTNVNSLNSYSIMSIQSINPLVVSLFSWQVCWTGVLAHLRSSTVRQMYPVSTLTMDFSRFVIKFALHCRFFLQLRDGLSHEAEILSRFMSRSPISQAVTFSIYTIHMVYSVWTRVLYKQYKKSNSGLCVSSVKF